MTYQITLYYNTGFNMENVPDSGTILELATKKTMNNHIMLQKDGLAYFDMQGTLEDIEGADYCKIGNTYYFVTGYSMINDNNCRVSLRQDSLTTIGINNMTFTSGWTKRWCPSNNTIFSNIVDEPFTPREEFVVNTGERIGAYSPNNLNLLGANIDLEQATNKEAMTYSDPADPENRNMLVPRLPGPATSTAFKCDLPGWDYLNALPFIAFYDPTDPSVVTAVGNVRSLGIESCIQYCYQVPKSYLSSNDKTGARYTRISGINEVVTANSVKSKYGSYQAREAKSYSGQFHKVQLVGMLSGEKSQEYRPEDIIVSGETSPKFRYFSDPQPDGTVYFRPYSYKGDTDNVLIETIKGLPWRNVPIYYRQRSGQDLVDTNFGINKRIAAMNLVGSYADVVGKTLGGVSKFVDESAVKGTGDIIGGFAQAVKAQTDYTMNQYNYEYKSKIVAPEVNFPRAEGLQSYLPNSGWVWSYHLSDNDLQRFDDFLTRFGWADFKKLEKSDIFTRVHFNYIQCEDVNISAAGFPLWMRVDAKHQLEGGTRVWHELPNEAAYSSNSVK